MTTTYSGFSTNFTTLSDSSLNIDLFSNAIVETYNVSSSNGSGWYSSEESYTTYTFFIGCLGFIVSANVDINANPYSSGQTYEIQYSGTSNGPFGTNGALQSIYSIILTGTTITNANAPACIQDISENNAFKFSLTSNGGNLNFLIVGLKYGCNNPTTSLFGSGYTTNFTNTNETNDIISTTTTSSQFVNDNSVIFPAYTCSIGNVSMVISDYLYNTDYTDSENTISWTTGEYWNWTLTSSTGTSTINNVSPTLTNATPTSFTYSIDNSDGYISFFLIGPNNTQNTTSLYSGFTSLFNSIYSSNDILSSVVKENYQNSTTSGWYSTNTNYKTYTFYVGNLAFVIGGNSDPNYEGGTTSSYTIQYNGANNPFGQTDGPFGNNNPYNVFLTGYNSNSTGTYVSIESVNFYAFSFNFKNGSSGLYFIIIGPNPNNM
jgi:hypothetical protein